MTHQLEQKQIKALSSYTFHHLNANLEGNNKYTIDMANIHTWATCGKIFRRKYDLRRHENTVHSEDTSSGEDEDSKSEDSESENEEQSEVETSESETSSNVDLEDNDIYQRWYERSMQVSEPTRTEKYVGAGMSERQAREKAYERTLWATKSNFFDTYEEFMEATVQLEEDDTHQEIIADIELKKKCEEASTLVKLLKEYFLFGFRQSGRCFGSATREAYGPLSVLLKTFGHVPSQRLLFAHA